MSLPQLLLFTEPTCASMFIHIVTQSSQGSVEIYLTFLLLSYFQSPHKFPSETLFTPPRMTVSDQHCFRSSLLISYKSRYFKWQYKVLGFFSCPLQIKFSPSGRKTAFPASPTKVKLPQWQSRDRGVSRVVKPQTTRSDFCHCYPKFHQLFMNKHLSSFLCFCLTYGALKFFKIILFSFILVYWRKGLLTSSLHPSQKSHV